MKNKIQVIEITANWHDKEGFKPAIKVREPQLADHETKAFFQTLRLPHGWYRLEFEYDEFLDKGSGFSLKSVYEKFSGLKINGKVQFLEFVPQEETGRFYTAACTFMVQEDVREIHLRLEWMNTRVMRSWIKRLNDEVPSGNTYYAIPPETGGEYLLVHGIPFLSKHVDIRNFIPSIPEPASDGGNLFKNRSGSNLSCGGVKIKTAHFLGMIHNFDIANGSWSCRKGDHGYSHFVGDKAGEIIIYGTDGEKYVIPLVFGFNLWYSKPWDVIWHFKNPYEPGPGGDNSDHLLFGGQDRKREVLRDNLSLTDGMRLMGSYSCNSRFIFSVDLQCRPVQSIEVAGVEDMYGFPLISAVTLEIEGQASGQVSRLLPLPLVCNEDPHVNPVSLEYIENKGYLSGVEKIKKLLYTFLEELPVLKTPEIPEGYFGPDYDFRGRHDALYAATYLYRNGPECAAHIADSGTGCSSSTAKWWMFYYTLGMGVRIKLKPLYDGIGDWFQKYRESNPGNFPGTGNAWSRGIGELLRETIAFGYDKYVDTYIDWLDHALFTDANPPHWNRVVGGPEICTYKTRVGDVEEKGNRENDGHGICMWGRYIAWHRLGRSKEWNEKHWTATEASVEWIKWQLDNDTIRPGVRKDVLYTESECAGGSYDFYSSYNCLHGIKLAIRMAEQLEKTDTVKCWLTLYERIRRGILDHLTDDSEFGLIWHTEADCAWQDHAHKLAHIQLAADGDSYTPLQFYADGDKTEKRYLEIDRNSYRYLMKDKNYNCLRMYGYGQGMMTQAALLFDEMEDAEQFLHMLLTYCYLPDFEGWTSPEGIIVHKSGKYYLPVNGYVGQDAHVADSTKAVRLLLGIDDNDPDHLCFVPRYPAGWDYMSIRKYPVLAGKVRQYVDYTYTRENNCHRFVFEFEQPVENISIRLGPIPSGTSALSAKLDGLAVPFKNVKSGDSWWVWIKNLSGVKGILEVDLKR